MRVTAWTNEDYARKHFIDPQEMRLKLLNPDKVVMITPKELEEMAESRGISKEEMFNIWHDEYEKIPTYIDEVKAKEYAELEKEIEECVIDHCRKTGIRFSSDYHQYREYGIPILDNRYLYFTYARTWGKIMALADGDESDMGYLRYYLYDEKEPKKYPYEVESEKLLN